MAGSRAQTPTRKTKKIHNITETDTSLWNRHRNKVIRACISFNVKEITLIGHSALPLPRVHSRQYKLSNSNYHETVSRECRKIISYRSQNAIFTKISFFKVLNEQRKKPRFHGSKWQRYIYRCKTKLDQIKGTIYCTVNLDLSRFEAWEMGILRHIELRFIW